MAGRFKDGEREASFELRGEPSRLRKEQTSWIVFPMQTSATQSDIVPGTTP